jgi:hypothetical protein
MKQLLTCIYLSGLLALTGIAHAKEFNGASKLDGLNMQSVPVPGVAEKPVAEPQSPVDSPDDIYWDNSMSHIYRGIDGPVYSMTVFEDRLIAAGRFSIAGATLANNIAAWDGTTWFPLGNGIGGDFPAVKALIAYDGKLVAGGGFTSADDAPVNNVAIWDGNSWSPMGDGLTDTVSALAVYEGELYAASYTGRTFDSSLRATLFKWDGSAWIAIASSTTSIYYDLQVYDGKLIVGTYTGLRAWNGTSLSPWGTDLTGIVKCLLEHDGQLFVGGYFNIPGQPPGKHTIVASWNGQWTQLYTSENGSLNDIFYFDDQLYAVIGHSLISWDGYNWSTPTYIQGSFYFASFAAYQGILLIGGDFLSIGDYKAGPNIAVWDGSKWSHPNLGFDDSILALQTYHDKLIAGGTFQTAGDGTEAKGVASWDGTSWSALGDGLEGPPIQVSRMTVFEDKLIIAGYFALAGGSPAYNVASWNGNNWSYLGEWAYGDFGELVVYNGQLMATEKHAYGGATGGILVWDGNSWTPITTMPQNGGEAYGQAIVFDDQLIVEHIYLWCPPNDDCDWIGFPQPLDDSYSDMWDGTQLSRMGNLISSGIISYTDYHGRLLGVFLKQVWTFYLPLVYEWDGEVWSLMPELVNKTNSIGDFQMHNEKLYIAGRNVYALDEDTLQPLGSGINGFGRVMTVYKNNLIVAGDFTVAGGKVAPSIAAWTKQEAREVTLDIKPGSCPNPINGNSAHGQGKAVLPVAIMGTADFDVHDIDLTTVTLNGSNPVRWDYHDVGAPPDDPDDECACAEAGPDGYDDLTMKFYSAEIVASLGDESVVRVEGQLFDGTSFEGQDCVTLVGDGGGKAAGSPDEGRDFELMVNTPNPFNPTTQISFYLPESAPVQLEIFNVLGQRVAILIDQTMQAGEHSVTWDGSQAASGIYYYRLHAGDEISTNKMLLLK